MKSVRKHYILRGEQDKQLKDIISTRRQTIPNYTETSAIHEAIQSLHNSLIG